MLVMFLAFPFIQTRKQLLAGDFRDKHYTTGAILLGGGVFVSILGCFDTYFRAGKVRITHIQPGMQCPFPPPP